MRTPDTFLAEIFPTSVFVHCKRDVVYLAQSLLEGRRERQGGDEHWFSLRPKEYTDLVKLPVAQQIAGQIKHSLEAIESGFAGLAEGRSLEVSYEGFCQDPRHQVKRIVELVRRRGEPISWESRPHTAKFYGDQPTAYRSW